jgi:hypothetical protein
MMLHVTGRLNGKRWFNACNSSNNRQLLVDNQPPELEEPETIE